MYEKIWNQNKIAFGGDYNRSSGMRQPGRGYAPVWAGAHWDTVTLNVFSQAMSSWTRLPMILKLDRIMELVKKTG